MFAEEQNCASLLHSKLYYFYSFIGKTHHASDQGTELA